MSIVELKLIRSGLSYSTDESFGLHKIVLDILKAYTFCCKFLSAGCYLGISFLKVLMITLDPTDSILSLLLQSLVRAKFEETCVHPLSLINDILEFIEEKEGLLVLFHVVIVDLIQSEGAI